MKLNLTEIFGRGKIAQQERELFKESLGMNVDMEIQSLEDLKKVYNEFEGDVWQEESVVNLEEQDEEPKKINSKKGQLKVGIETDETVRDVRETGDPEGVRIFDNDDFNVSADAQEDIDYWEGGNDPEKVRNRIDLENIAGDDETDALDNWGLKNIIEKTEEPVMAASKKPQPKQEKKAEVLKKKELPYAVTRFKRMQAAVEYNALVASNPNIEKLRPTRGDIPLSTQQIVDEINSFEDRKKKGEKSSVLEKEFIQKCKSWVWAVTEIEKFKDGEPRLADGTVLDMKEVKELSKEYFALKNKEPENYAIMQLELLGEKKLASGEWKKGEFTWEHETYQGTDRWICQKGADIYITYENPQDIADEEQTADFFYTIKKEFVSAMKMKRFFISIKVPFIAESNKGKKVSV